MRALSNSLASTAPTPRTRHCCPARADSGSTVVEFSQHMHVLHKGIRRRASVLRLLEVLRTALRYPKMTNPNDDAPPDGGHSASSELLDMTRRVSLSDSSH